MPEQEAVKVYELAKELGIDSISLLDKLKDLNIKVKNHMSELNGEEIRQARSALKKSSNGASSSTAKKTVARTRKKVETPAVQAGASTAAPESSNAEKKSAPIIRRRVKSDGVTETHTSAAARSPLAEAPSGATAYSGHVASDERLESLEGISGTGAEAYSVHPPVDVATESELTEEPTFSAVVEEEAPAENQLGTAHQQAPVAIETGEEAPAASNVSVPAPGGLTASPAAPTHTPVTGNTRPLRPPVVLPPRPVAPRRSILKIVEPAAPPPRPMVKPAVSAPGTGLVIGPKPAVRGVTTQDKDGFRIIKMSKENLDQMVEEEAAKKRGGGRENDIRPEDVRFADYRKKEMVFLPKKKKLPVGKEIRKTKLTEAKAQKRVVEMKDTISVQDLANQLAVKAVDVVRKLMSMGQMATINQSLDFDTATLVANDYKHEVRNVAFNEKAILQKDSQDLAEDLKPRPPIVTIMGHVDHGKTTLLDAIREANVAGAEAGGITQHIGAYTVEKNGKLITFIDTPGHEAFSVMRARGANVTDIVILVVSADDGVMPQTREALSHAQAAKVPIIVAVNKIDKPGANPEKIKQGLAELNLLAEDWGGDTMFVPVSALKRTNLDKLLDAILLQAEVLDLKGNPDALASGTLLEARLDKGKGPVISLLVKRGTLRVGDPIVAGSHAGKVRALTDDKGRAVKEALPGFAVEVLGFEGVPSAGERFDATPTDADARKIAGDRIDRARSKALAGQGKISLEDLFSKIQMGDVKELNVILKADVFGSVEAIKESLIKASTEKVKVKVIHAAPGGITESDVLLGTASNAIIIGFNVRPETKARQVAEAEHVEIKCYSIIYELLDDIKKAMAGLLDKKKVERFLGRAEVRQIFSVPKVGVVAGSSVVDGKILRGANVRLLRDSRIIYDGKMSSLRRFKDDVKEVATGFECGIGIENYNDLKPGDLIEAYQIDLITPTLDA